VEQPAGSLKQLHVQRAASCHEVPNTKGVNRMLILKKPWLWHTLTRVGMNTRNRFRVKALAHKAGVRKDPTVEALEQLREAMERSKELLKALEEEPPKGPPVLIWTMRGGFGVNAVEGIIAWALRLRGVDVRIVLCNTLVPLCENKRITFYPSLKVRSDLTRSLCDPCIFQANCFFSSLGLPTFPLTSLVDKEAQHRARELVNSLSRDEIFDLQYKGIHLGPIIRSSVVRFFMKIHLDEDPQTESVIKQYALGAVLIADAADRILNGWKPRALFTSHGIYILWGIVTEMARQRGIPVTTWGLGKRRSTIILGHGASYFEEFVEMGRNEWENFPWTSVHRDKIVEYLSNRWSEDRMKIDFRGNRSRGVLSSLGLDSTKPTLGLFPNVSWDAQIYYRNIAFPDVFAWVLYTVDFFTQHPDYQLVIRCHPMEHYLGGGALENVEGVIAQRYPKLPPNVRVIPSADPLNSYELAREIRAAAVHGTELGLELACRGTSVIVTGGAIYRNKGFTYDVQSPEEYTALLERLRSMDILPEDKMEQALKFAYYYHFVRAIPMKYLSHQVAGLKDISLNSLHDLLPGKDINLDITVEAILKGQKVLAIA